MIETIQTQEKRDALECETDMMTALSRLFGEAYHRGRAQGRNDRQREDAGRQPASHGSTPTTATFDGGLVERLTRVLAESMRQPGPVIADYVRAILSELASMPGELPTDEQCVQQFFDCGVGESYPESVARLMGIIRARIAPILAVKDATIEVAHCRIAELEKSLIEDVAVFCAQTKEASKLLNEALDQRDKSAERVVELLNSMQEQRDREDRLNARIRELSAPVDATGKTPGQVNFEAFANTAHTKLNWQHHVDPDERVAWESSAQAVLRAFGNGAEALRRVRERVQTIETHFRDDSGTRLPHTAKGAIKDFVAIVDDELALLGASITDPTKPTKPILEALLADWEGLLSSTTITEGYRAGTRDCIKMLRKAIEES